MSLAAAPFGISFNGGVAGLFLQTGAVGKIVLFILLFFSVVTWAVMLQKFLYLRKSQAQTNRFLNIFRSSNNLTSIYAHSKTLSESQLAKLYMIGYMTLRNLQRRRRGANPASEAVSKGEDSITIRDFQEIERVLIVKANQEMALLEKYLIFLATAGSATPFIGLFGTVWGVMSAFRGLGIRTSASIEAVAPGISEALIATAAGLVVAIPAVIGYNYLINKAKTIGGEMDNFNSEFLSLVERNFVKSH
jgi:biopolymer transport protein TolQ